jgi:hypothetical protein
VSGGGSESMRELASLPNAVQWLRDWPSCAGTLGVTEASFLPWPRQGSARLRSGLGRVFAQDGTRPRVAVIGTSTSAWPCRSFHAELILRRAARPLRRLVGALFSSRNHRVHLRLRAGEKIDLAENRSRDGGCFGARVAAYLDTCKAAAHEIKPLGPAVCAEREMGHSVTAFPARRVRGNGGTRPPNRIARSGPARHSRSRWKIDCTDPRCSGPAE